MVGNRADEDIEGSILLSGSHDSSGLAVAISSFLSVDCSEEVPVVFLGVLGNLVVLLESILLVCGDLKLSDQVVSVSIEEVGVNANSFLDLGSLAEVVKAESGDRADNLSFLAA